MPAPVRQRRNENDSANARVPSHVKCLFVVTHPEATHHVEGLVGGWHDSTLDPAVVWSRRSASRSDCERSSLQRLSQRSTVPICSGACRPQRSSRLRCRHASSRRVTCARSRMARLRGSRRRGSMRGTYFLRRREICPGWITSSEFPAQRHDEKQENASTGRWTIS